MEEQLNEPFDELLARITGIAMVLADKGICTAEDFTNAIMKARAGIKQKREEDYEKSLSELRATQ